MPGSFYKETSLLVRSIRGKKVLLLTHVRPDWDTLSSAFALTQFLARDAKQTTLGLVEKPSSVHTPFFTHFSPPHKIITDLAGFDTVICLDFRSPTQAGPLAPVLSAFKGTLVILDHHHAPSKDFSPRAIRLVRPSSIATAQMVTQIGQEMGVDFSKPVARALAIALLTDSVRFLLANSETFAIMDFLLRASGISYEKLLEIANPPMSASTRISTIKSVREVQLYEIGSYILAMADNPYHGSVTANALIQLGADVGVGLFHSDEGVFSTIRVSSRAHDELKFDAMKAVHGFATDHEGSAGGHAQAAQLNLPPYFSEALVRDFFQRIVLEHVRRREKTAVVRKR